VKRIGLVINNLAGGGAEKVVINLARMFMKYGVDAHIFILEDQIAYDTEGLNIHKLLREKKKNRLFKQKSKKEWAGLLEKRIKEIEEDGILFDAVFSNLPLTDRVMKYMRIKNPIYYIIHTTYSLEINELRKRKEYLRALRRKHNFKQLYQNQRLVCVSKGIEKDLKISGISPKESRVVYNPFDFTKIERMGAYMPDDLPFGSYIIHVGAFRKEKRHDVLLKAYAKLTDPPKLLLMCKYDEKLQDMINHLGLTDKVKIFGFRSNPYPYINHAKLLILSSSREGLPTVLIEALALKTPVVSTDCISGPNEILTGSLSNYLAKVNDSSDLAEKIEEALVSYPKIDRQHYEKFSEESIFSQYRELLERRNDK